MNAKEYSKISETPYSLLTWAGRNPIENIRKRKELHSFLFSDEGAKTDFLAKCFVDPRIFFNLCLWTFNAQAEHGYKHIPFILWKNQEIAVLRIKKAIEELIDLLFDKSRKQGATYIILGVFLLYWLLSQGSMFLLGSRKEDLVDNGCEIIEGSVVGSEESLFYKLLYMINTLPLYLQPKMFKKSLFLQNLEMDSAFRGDTTNIGFGKGFRTTANLVDEAAQIDPKMAKWIIENIADTAPCSIFNSTTGPWASSHPYSKLMKSNPGNIIVLDWTDNPLQGAGLYRSDDVGYIKIRDVDYYRRKYPGVFDNVKSLMSIEVSQIKWKDKKYDFICDAGVSNYGCWRSPWFDSEEKRPSRTKRGIAQNILRIETGSSDAFFEYDLIIKLRERVKEPDYIGDISYILNQDDPPSIMNVRFNRGGKDSSLKWWGSFYNGRPNQRHNYTVGCDISRGTGSSNSVVAVYDRNTNEICGLYVNPYIKISDFAEKVVAICNWVGGEMLPLLNWETNNAPEFLDRVKELNYYNLYVGRDDTYKKIKVEKKYGWHSSGGLEGSKRKILNELSVALNEGLRRVPRFLSCRVYDEQLVNELESYINYEGKIDVGPVALQTETSGAKAAHGDRVIGVSVALLGGKEQPKANPFEARYIPDGTFAARMAEVEARIAKEKAEQKIWLF